MANDKTAVLEVSLTDKDGKAIDKHVAMRRILAAEFMVPIMTGNVTDVDVEEIKRWKNAIVKMTKAFDERLLALPESERGNIEPFRKPRADKGQTAQADLESLLD